MHTTAIILAAGNSRRMKHLTKDMPKSMLRVGTKKVIEYHLDNLYRNNVSEIIIVVGYLSKVIEEYIGYEYRSIPIKYVFNEKFASTGHSLSLWKGYKNLNQKTSNILLVHADGILDPEIYIKTLTHNSNNVMPYDAQYKVRTNDEIFIFSNNGLVTGVRDIKEGRKFLSGEMIGLHKFNMKLFQEFNNFLEKLNFQWEVYNYEPLLNQFIITNKPEITSLDIGHLGWINMNYEEDINCAKNQLIPNFKKKLSNKLSLYSTVKNVWDSNLEISEKNGNSIDINNFLDLNTTQQALTKYELDIIDVKKLVESIMKSIKKDYGFIIVRGLNDFKDDQSIKIFYKLLCQKIGKILYQDSKKTTFYPVFNAGLSMVEGGRYSRSSDSGSFHTDNPSEINVPDLVGLLSLKEAFKGGLSCIVNMFLVLEDLYTNHPKLAYLLEEKFKFTRKNNIDDENQINLFPIVTLNESFSFRYLSDYIDKIDESNEKLQILKLLDNNLCQNQFRKEFLLKRGEILFFNNLSLAHGRTSFIESENHKEKRLMYRVWIKTSH